MADISSIAGYFIKLMNRCEKRFLNLQPKSVHKTSHNENHSNNRQSESNYGEISQY